MAKYLSKTFIFITILISANFSFASEKVELTDDHNTKFIEHPYAEKGLIKIDRDKVYHYQTEVKKGDRSSSLKFGSFDPTSISSDSGVNYSEIYPNPGYILLYDYEWKLYRGGLGRFGVKAGTGFFSTTGKGIFENQNETPEENFSFYVFPNSVSAIYYLQFWDTQLLVPYLEGGVGYYAFAEARDDDENPSWGARLGGALTSHAAGGLAFNLGRLNKNSLFDLNSQYGIYGVWLTAEVRQIIGLHESFDFTSTVFDAGVMVEF